MLMYVSIVSSTKNKHMKDVNEGHYGHLSMIIAYGEMQLIINL